MSKILAISTLLATAASALSQTTTPYGWSRNWYQWHDATQVTVSFSAATTVSVWNKCTERNGVSSGPSWHVKLQTLVNESNDVEAPAGTYTRWTWEGTNLFAEGWVYRPFAGETNQTWLYPERERTARWYTLNANQSAD